MRSLGDKNQEPSPSSLEQLVAVIPIVAYGPSGPSGGGRGSRCSLVHTMSVQPGLGGRCPSHERVLGSPTLQ